MEILKIEDFPLKTFDKIRYADTDRQGHVNNAVFATFLETGRVEVLYSKQNPILAENCSFVIASLNLQFISEIRWPGNIDIATGVVRIGGSSISLYQQLFQQEKCVATAETVIVQVSDETGRGSKLSETARKSLESLLVIKE